MKNDPQEEQSDYSRLKLVRKALMVSVTFFFFGVFLFIGIVIVIAKFASKTYPGN